MNKIAFDIGGTGVQYALFIEGTRENGEFSVVNKDKEFTLNKMAELIMSINAKFVGISSPCAVDSETGQLFGNSGISGYENFNLYEELKTKVNYDFKIIAMNDGNSALFGNVNPEIKNAVQIAIGTGIGGGLYINKKIHEGNLGMGGEFGYSPVWFKGRIRITSNTCSTVALVDEVNEVHNKNYNNAIEIFKENIPGVQETIDKWVTNLSFMIVEKHFSIAPDVIFLSGGITNNETLMNKVKESCNKIIEDIGVKGFEINIQIPKTKNQSLEGAIKLMTLITDNN